MSQSNLNNNVNHYRIIQPPAEKQAEVYSSHFLAETHVKAEQVEIIWPLIFSVCFVKSAWRLPAVVLPHPPGGIKGNPLHIHYSNIYYYHTHDGLVHGNALLNTCIHVLLDEPILWNVFWFLMLCGGGSIHYVRGCFYCVLLLRPEEREFSSLTK